jgi:predicted porin
MKKSLVALAALAASAAFAQSSVTLYGIVDMGYGTINHSPTNDPYNSAAGPVQPTSAGMLNSGTAAAPVIAPRLTSMLNNNTVTSRWGIKGVEDIGGGTKANFTLESFLNPATGSNPNGKQNDSLPGSGATANSLNAEGSATGAMFAREATVGLEGGMGSLKLGRQLTPMADAIGAYDPMRAGFAVSPLGFNGGYSGGGYTNEARWDNSAKYAYDLNANTKLTAGYRTGNLTGQSSATSAFSLKGEYNTADWGAVVGYTADNGAINSGAGASNGLVNVTSNSTATPAAAATTANSIPGLALTVADTRATMLAFRVTQGAVTYKLGYQHIQLQNSGNPSAFSTTTIPSLYGYAVASVNTAAFNTPRVQDVYWLGANWQVSAPLELSAAYYRRNDSTYGSQGSSAAAGTTTPYTLAATSKADYLSFMAKYSLSKRTNLYATFNTTKVSGGAWSSASTTVSTGGTSAAVTSYGTVYTAPNLQVITVGMAHSF